MKCVYDTYFRYLLLLRYEMLTGKGLNSIAYQIKPRMSSSDGKFTESQMFLHESERTNEY